MDSTEQFASTSKTTEPAQEKFVPLPEGAFSFLHDPSFWSANPTFEFHPQTEEPASQGVPQPSPAGCSFVFPDPPLQSSNYAFPNSQSYNPNSNAQPLPFPRNGTPGTRPFCLVSVPIEYVHETQKYIETLELECLTATSNAFLNQFAQQNQEWEPAPHPPQPQWQPQQEQPANDFWGAYGELDNPQPSPAFSYPTPSDFSFDLSTPSAATSSASGLPSPAPATPSFDLCFEGANPNQVKEGLYWLGVGDSNSKAFVDENMLCESYGVPTSVVEPSDVNVNVDVKEGGVAVLEKQMEGSAVSMEDDSEDEASVEVLLSGSPSPSLDD